MADIYTMGVDIGSTSSKCVILKNGTEVVATNVIPAGTGTSGPSRAVLGTFEKAGLNREDISALTATGYGRNTFEGADFCVSELTCHAKGAHASFPEVRTVIDIGGQDAKCLQLGDDGKLVNFIMNDKCAAGTGRFLDVMAHILELDVSELEKAEEDADGVAQISSTCTVFAESEVISQLSRNVKKANLVKGIHASVATKTVSLVKRLGVKEPVLMTGGVAQNAGVVHALENELNISILVSPMAQLNGAYGAALHAYEEISRNS